MILASDRAQRLAGTAPDNLMSLQCVFTWRPQAVTAALLQRIAGDGPGVSEMVVRAPRTHAGDWLWSRRRASARSCQDARLRDPRRPAHHSYAKGRQPSPLRLGFSCGSHRFPEGLSVIAAPALARLAGDWPHADVRHLYIAGTMVSGSLAVGVRIAEQEWRGPVCSDCKGVSV